MMTPTALKSVEMISAKFETAVLVNTEFPFLPKAALPAADEPAAATATFAPEEPTLLFPVVFVPGQFVVPGLMPVLGPVTPLAWAAALAAAIARGDPARHPHD